MATSVDRRVVDVIEISSFVSLHWIQCCYPLTIETLSSALIW